MNTSWITFGSDAYVVSEVTPDHLLITVPGSALGWPWLYVFFFVLFVVVTYTTSRSVRRAQRPLAKSPEELNAYVRRYRIIGSVLSFAGIGAFWLIAYSSGSIELDRRNDLATVRAKFTAFLPAETASMPLSMVNEATLESQPNARRIRLIGNSGKDLAYPLWTSRAGQAEAARAINRFLACAGCDSSDEAEIPAGNTKGGVSLLRFANGKLAEDWSRNIRACRRNSGPIDFSFGTGNGGPILTVAKYGENSTVVLNGPHGPITFTQTQCHDLAIELRPTVVVSQGPNAPGRNALGGRIDIECKSDAGELNGAIDFEHCGR